MVLSNVCCECFGGTEDAVQSRRLDFSVSLTTEIVAIDGIVQKQGVGESSNYHADI